MTRAAPGTEVAGAGTAPGALQTNLLGIALGGGGARGLCHIGVWRVLQELEVRPDLVSGTSMGGLVGAFIAAGYSATELEEITASIGWLKLIDWGLSGRLLSTKAYRAFLEEHLPPTFEELELPLVLTTTDVVDGQIHYLRSGDLHTAIRATTAYPGLVEPVPLGDAILVDGGILNQIPVDGALFLGARRVIAVNATALEPLERPRNVEKVLRRRPVTGAFKEAMRAIDVMQTQLTMARLSLYRPDVLIDPPIEGVDIQDFHKAKEAIAAGDEATRAAADRIRRLIAVE
ncbi:patatin-like phospholipase family protein [Ornithinimicrobium pratense]|uniref:patatin-like phospholipase family protein n=1 Tax=Ornithinimicrobium pratense TaxID=2593973 RepID=UPI001EE33AB2|nr:patatin-like phospholipase family protein [Ornithinimicrobium pratense]